MIIFDSATIVKPSTFAAGIINLPVIRTSTSPVRRSPFTTLDAAWYAGFSAGKEDGAGVLPPAGMTDEQTFAWLQGCESAVIGADDDGDWDHGELEMRANMAEFQELYDRGVKVY